MRLLALVSAPVTPDLRAAVAAGIRPRPEFLYLEEDHGADLLDWESAGLAAGHRSVGRSVRHAGAALRRIRRYDAVLSDGEHIGIPLARAMQALRLNVPHAMIGHHLLTRNKQLVLRYPVRLSHVDRVIVHSPGQVEGVVAALGGPADRVAVVPYGIDTRFWRPAPAASPEVGAGSEEAGLVVSAGREHRDYATLVAALPPGAGLTIADHSPYTPAATRRDPPEWPAHVARVALDPAGLRELYARAQVVVVPVVASTMPAGITTLLEAMAMGKAVVVTETVELRGVVTDGVTGLTTQPGDVAGLRRSIESLLGDDARRQALGHAAQAQARKLYDSRVFAGALAEHLRAISEGAPTYRGAVGTGS